MQLIAMDLPGPIQVTLLGNKHVLVVGNNFTRWMEAYPIPTQESLTVATKLVDESEQLHSDEGCQFELDVVKEIFKLLHIFHSPFFLMFSGKLKFHWSCCMFQFLMLTSLYLISQTTLIVSKNINRNFTTSMCMMFPTNAGY